MGHILLSAASRLSNSSRDSRNPLALVQIVWYRKIVPYQLQATFSIRYHFGHPMEFRYRELSVRALVR